MNWISGGGIPIGGQPLCGWPALGIPGGEISGDTGGRGGGGYHKQTPKYRSRDDRDIMDILTMIAGFVN